MSVEDDRKKVEEELLLIRQEKLKALEAFNKYHEMRPGEFIHWYGWQKRVLELIPRYNIGVVSAPNKIGKTACISNIASSWALGYEPWTRTDKDGGYHVKRNNKWYRKSTLGKEPPVKIRITGNDWRSHINETIVPELVKWLPKDKYDTRSDNGMVCKIIFDNGSTIELLSHQEKFDVFESWIGDAWIPDEPPNKEIYDAMGRGLFLNNGKVLIFTTLLSQPWIVDELLEPEIPRSDVFLIDDLTFLDNDDLKQYDTELLRTIGYNDSQINEYFRVLLDFENKTKPQHLKEVDDYLKQCLNLN